MNRIAPAPAEPLLEVRHLSLRLPTAGGTVQAVTDVGFRLSRGKTLAILGESGSGKTMLCRTLMGLQPKTAILAKGARIILEGKKIAGISEKAYNRIRAARIAMVFQDPLSALTPLMTVGRQIAEPLVVHRRLRPGPARRRAVELLEAVGIAEPQRRAGQYPHELSGGMRQRVAIAAALACDPALLIADEPTTALDVTVQESILDLLCREQARRKMALILVTHDLHIAAGRAHEAAVMYAGRIVEQIPAVALLSGAVMPYTRALIDALPPVDRPPHAALYPIEGQPPDLKRPIPGCAFAPRCRRADRSCEESAPPLAPGPGPGHRVACRHPFGMAP